MTQWGVDVLFNPAKRHMDEEKRRLQSTREEIGDSSGGKRIDFESGKVTIERPKAKADTEEDEQAVSETSSAEPRSAEPAAEDAASEEDAAVTTTTTEAADEDETSAADEPEDETSAAGEDETSAAER